VALELTEAGRSVVDGVNRRRRRDLRRVLDGLSPTERAACVAALDHVHELLAGAPAAEPYSTLPL